MYIKIIENNGVLINESKGVIINPNLQFGVGLKQSYPDANLPLSDNDKLIIQQGNDYKFVKNSEIGGTMTNAEVKTAYESNSNTNCLTDNLKSLLELKKVKDISTDAVNNRLVITYIDSTQKSINLDDIVTDIHVSGASLDATTNVLTLTSADGGTSITVDLSDFVNSSELATALDAKVDKEAGKGLSTNDFTTPEKNKLSSLFIQPKIVNTFQQIVDGYAGIYYLSALDNSIAENPKRIGLYYKLESGFIELLNPKTYEFNMTFYMYVDANKKYYRASHYFYGRNYVSLNYGVGNNDLFSSEITTPLLYPQNHHFKIDEIYVNGGHRQNTLEDRHMMASGMLGKIDGNNVIGKRHIILDEWVWQTKSNHRSRYQQERRWENLGVMKTGEIMHFALGMDNTIAGSTSKKNIYAGEIRVYMTETINL